MDFKDFLIIKAIEFEETQEGFITVDDSDLLPYEDELKELFPDVKFFTYEEN